MFHVFTFVTAGHSTVRVVPIARWEWLLNALGFFTLDYWQSMLKPSPILDWYFRKMESTISEALKVNSQVKKLNIIGHSVGGWLTRVYLAEYNQSSNIQVKSLITLGTPHLAPPQGLIGEILLATFCRHE